MKIVPVEAVAALFLRGQHLDQPLKRPFTQESLTRFGPYDKAALDKIVYEKRAVVVLLQEGGDEVARSLGLGRAADDGDDSKREDPVEVACTRSFRRRARTYRVHRSQPPSADLAKDVRRVRL